METGAVMDISRLAGDCPAVATGRRRTDEIGMEASMIDPSEREQRRRDEMTESSNAGLKADRTQVRVAESRWVLQGSSQARG